MKWPKLALPTKIMLGLLLGAAFGIVANRAGWQDFVGEYVKPVGTAFVKLITMVVIPLVFASLLVGTASLNDIRKLGRIGICTAAYYVTTTVIAISIGLVLANIFKPGASLPEETKAQLLASGAQDMTAKVEQMKQKPSLKDTLLNIIPSNPIQSFAEGKMLQVIFFALLTGICLTLVPDTRGAPVIAFFEGLNDVMIRMVHVIMHIAPYAVFALIAAVTANFGAEILRVLTKYALVVLLGLILHACLVYSMAVKVLARTKVWPFFKGIRPAQLIAFSSSSSSAALPVTMECAEENLGVPREIASFALPLGATINMDGTALYQGVAAAFIAQVYGMDLNVGQQLTIVLTATLASIGTAGTPGAGMAMLVIVLKSIGVPIEGIGLILGLDRILDMCRTAVNVTGDASCAMVVAAMDGQLGQGPRR
ncbi:MAG: dicarboxylate/amino acid:cation symporter [Phycisphaerales bacterium]|nr:MAG: dicarboxylate/amino acid:cation symporter [Phycisphaerales bacterium]